MDILCIKVAGLSRRKLCARDDCWSFGNIQATVLNI